jgi:hypothetical protein
VGGLRSRWLLSLCQKLPALLPHHNPVAVIQKAWHDQERNIVCLELASNSWSSRGGSGSSDSSEARLQSVPSGCEQWTSGPGPPRASYKAQTCWASNSAFNRNALASFDWIHPQLFNLDCRHDEVTVCNGEGRKLTWVMSPRPPPMRQTAGVGGVVQD